MTSFIQTVFAPVGLNSNITSDTVVILPFPSFFERLDDKLRDLEDLGDAGKRQMANYIGWGIISSNIQ